LRGLPSPSWAPGWHLAPHKAACRRCAAPGLRSLTEAAPCRRRPGAPWWKNHPCHAPKPHRAGALPPFCVRQARGCGGNPQRADAPGRPWSPRLPTTPPHPLRHSWSAPQRVVSPRSHRAANAQIGRSRSARVRSGRKLRVGFVQAICYRAVHAGIVTTANRHEGPEALCAAVRSHNLQRG
jgi:hypothetical protein